MAKKSFKDLIFQYLKKDEDAPANATGTAVAGTGDDSSTVVVKKKKELQKKLMTRMGITETINRTIPDLEYPKDEIRERVNQLKELASIKEYDRGDMPYIIRYGKEALAKATAIAVKSDGQYSKAVREIEKIGKDLSKVSTIARALKTANEQIEQPEKEQPEKEKKESENKDSVIASLKDQISMLKQKLENEKNKAIKPEPNPETGEVPLTIGLANKLLKDKEMKKENVQEADLSKPQIKKVHKMADELPKKDFKDRYGKEKGDAVRYATATNIVKKKLGIEENQADMMFKKLSQRAQTYVNELLRSGMGTMEAIAKAKEKFNEGNMKNEEMRLRVEAIAGLKKKAEKSGMPYSILKKVYDRGMAAWKGGHRPGASQHQWAFARVNSFVTKSSGTWGKADSDLAAKVRGK